MLSAILKKTVLKRILVKIFNTFFYILVFLALSFVLYNSLTTSNIKLDKTEIITGSYKSIHRNKPKRKVSVSYNLEIENNPKILKIIPEYTKCFNYQQFISDVKPNQNIEIRIDKNAKFLFNNIKSVVSIRVNSKEYINLNCVNNQIKENKTKIPLILIGGIILIFLIILIQKRLGIKIN